MYCGSKRRHTEEELDPFTEELLIKELGYGSSLFKDSNDESYINNLKDLDKERILSERHEKIQICLERIHLLKKHQQKANSQSKALNELKEKREKKASKINEDIAESSEESSSQEAAEEQNLNWEQKDTHSDSELIDIERIHISRSNLERWYGELFFDETIKDAFVRVNIGESKDKKGWMYKVYKIIGLKAISQPYQFGNKKIDKELILKFGKTVRYFKMIVISNSRFTADEVKDYVNEWQRCNERLPTIDEINVIEAKIKKTTNYSYNHNEMNKIIEQNINQLIEDGSSSMNVTYIRTQLEAQLKIAKRELNENPWNEAQEIYDKLKSNIDKLNDIQKKKIEEKNNSNSIQNINDRARKLQIEEDRKRSEMI